MLALLLVAASLGLSNCAAAVGLGVAGVDARTRLRVGLIFGFFESAMPVVGLLIGDHVATQLGHAGRWIGGALLIGVGLYGIVGSLRAREEPAAGLEGAATASPLRLWLTGLALSVDNLVAGFALGTYRIGIVAGAILIGSVSVALSLAGLEFGARLGRLAGRGQARGSWAERRGDQVGGVILISVGVAIAAGALS
jgi:manganese efflux pump family protein